jgi:hypothetical protein
MRSGARLGQDHDEVQTRMIGVVERSGVGDRISLNVSAAEVAIQGGRWRLVILGAISYEEERSDERCMEACSRTWRPRCSLEMSLEHFLLKFKMQACIM